MSKNNDVKTLLKNVEALGKDKVVEYLNKNADVPDYETLKYQYLSRKANQIISSIKDAEGKREVFALRSGKKTNYINLNTCNNPFYLKSIYDKLNYRRKGIEKSIDKVYTKLSYVQTSMFEESTSKLVI